MIKYRVNYSTWSPHPHAYSVGHAMLVEADEPDDAIAIAAHHICPLPSSSEPRSSGRLLVGPDGQRYHIFEAIPYVEPDLPKGRVLGRIA
jgi:hypothetical protein